MIKAIIIEDEVPAANRLEKLLKEIEPEINILEKLDSVESSVNWLKENMHPDLLMLDIQLADGLSFEIFKEVKVESFVIFTTAYDEYAIKAFELNSIDYLLKPVNKELLVKSIDKFKAMQGRIGLNIEGLLKAMKSANPEYKSRFIVNVGNKIRAVETINIAYFYSLEKSTFLCTVENKHYPIDFSLDTLEKLINPNGFFRVNRQYILSYTSINEISVLAKSRIKLSVKPEVDDGIYVSTSKASEFRKWLDK